MPRDPGDAALEVDSEQLGRLAVPRERVFEFPWGLLGFPQPQTFCLLEVKAGSRFQLLQSCERSDLAFVVADPQLLLPNYDIEEVRGAAGSLIEREEPIAVAVIVTVRPPPDRSTANLLAPLIIGVHSRRGGQVVLARSELRIRYEL
jgi:flagellar assembly factor FliW